MFEPKITKDDLPLSFGSFKPTGHAVVVFPQEACADQLAQSLREHGLADADIVRLTPEEVVARFKPLLPEASGASGFGSEIQSMRQIYLLALEGHGLMIIRVTDDDMQERVAHAAREGKATLAKKYGLLTIEELI
ncbi:MAG: hypothetical protein IIZ92_24575 [Aquincola sp.]|nr:hypothetical protein [Aquincola sp.]